MDLVHDHLVGQLHAGHSPRRSRHDRAYTPA
jgi:hypothetical protein